MSTRPTNNSSENTNPNHDQETPQFALGIGCLPPDLPVHLIPNWGIKPASCVDELGGYGEGRALAIGPSGPPIRPLSEAELAAQAKAVNFNPYHDKRGRFTTSEGEGGGGNDGLDGQGGGETKPASIAQHTYPRKGKQDYNRCPLYSLQSTIASKTGQEAPNLAVIEAQFQAEAEKLGLKRTDWGVGTRLGDKDYATVVKNVLKSYGIDTIAASRYNSSQAVANAIIAAKGEPAILNIVLDGHEGEDEHSVTVQWEPSTTDPSKGVFRINNVAGDGASKVYSQEAFTSGKIYSDINPTSTALRPKQKGFSVDTKYAVVITKRR